MSKENLPHFPNQVNHTHYPSNSAVVHAYSNPEQNSDDDEIDLRELWGVLIRRKGTIIFIALLTLLAALVITVMSKPIYRASTTLQIQPETTKLLNYDISAQTNTPITTKDFYQTQYELLKSRQLAQQTIEGLELESMLQGEKIGKAYFSDTVRELSKFFTGASQEEVSSEVFSQDIAEEVTRPLEEKFLASLSVAPVKNSQIVTLHYEHTNPELAANIVNTHADNFIDMNLERRIDSAKYARDFVDRELEKAKSRLKESEKKLVDYARQQDIINISTNPENQQTLTGQRLTQLTRALAKAEEDRIAAESKFEQAKANSEHKILANVTIQALKKQLAEIEVKYQAELVTSSAYNNSVIKSLRSELAKLQGKLQAELASPSSRENSVVRGLRSELANLRTQLQGELTASSVYKSPAVQSLNGELQRLQAEYQEQLQIYKPAYPSMVQLKQRINEVNTQLKKEINTQQATNTNNLKQRINELQLQINQESQVIGSATQNSLREQINRLQNQIEDEINTVASATLANLGQRIKELKKQIKQERSSITRTIDNSLEADVLSAKQREFTLKKEFAEQKENLLNLEDKSLGYKELKREVEARRKTYEDLLKSSEDVSIASKIGSNNISVVDKALTPYNKHKPNTKLNLALGAVLGLFLGTVIAFLLEFIDDRVKTENDLDRILGLPILGMSPLVRNKTPEEQSLLSLNKPSSATAEAFRSLRTNLMFSTASGVPKTLLITSSMPSEAKSSTCSNLATAFSQAKNNILLVDADLRKPTMHKRLGLDNSRGLSTFLTQQAELEEVIQPTPIEHVSAIPAGTIPPNPSELLFSERLNNILSLAPDRFDMIIIDSPPVMGLADSLVLANRVNATILVVAHAQSKKRAIADSFQRLQRAQANVIGTVFTKVKTGASYGYSYDYYYAYGDTDTAITNKT